ncbi:MAG: excinuclease ABC subunit UvrC [Ruminococcaceae bacterium]|nr:excinuclease ABC subunit UvrC [Oscillospiraceae bacterium]
MQDRLRRLKDKANKLPLTPGVYIMKDKEGKIIYIGKAKALKNRVSQYFGSQENHLTKVRRMVENVEDFDYILTDSEFEALVLECSLIKQNMPKYNILLKDSKGFSYIKITKGWRNIYAVLQKDDSDADYLGPYTAGFSVTKAVEQAKKIYKLPTCNKAFPRDIGKERPCLNYHLGICCAPCSGKISLGEYLQNVDGALDFLKYGGNKTIKKLTAQMEEAAENLEFEKAAKIRDTIKSIEKVGNSQKVVFSTYKEQDVFALCAMDGKACFAVLRFEDNSLCDSEHFLTDESDELSTMRAQLITSYYSMNRKIPPRIEIDGEVEDKENIEKWLSEKRGTNVSIVIPQKGTQAKLVEMCKQNAMQKLSEKYRVNDRNREALEELAMVLGLSKTPEYIEAYDISHTGGSDNVAGMVVFKDGKPLKSAYRRFAIKGFTGQDDYGSMAEVLSRRFEEYHKGQSEGLSVGFARLPDLILLDGGKGQVNAVLPVMEQYGIDVPLYGMVKNSKHRTSAISTSNGRIDFNARKKAFTLVTNIQDEVHRYAVAYHHKKHKKSTLNATLTSIKGIGDKKAKNLMLKLKNLEAIGKADKETLMTVPGITEANAIEIIKAFKGE